MSDPLQEARRLSEIESEFTERVEARGYKAAMLEFAKALYTCEQRVEEAEWKQERILYDYYLADPVSCARLCDAELDQSGALLGRIRELRSQALRQEEE